MRPGHKLSRPLASSFHPSTCQPHSDLITVERVDTEQPKSLPHDDARTNAVSCCRRRTARATARLHCSTNRLVGYTVSARFKAKVAGRTSARHTQDRLLGLPLTAHSAKISVAHTSSRGNIVDGTLSSDRSLDGRWTRLEGCFISHDHTHPNLRGANCKNANELAKWLIRRDFPDTTTPFSIRPLAGSTVLPCLSLAISLTATSQNGRSSWRR